MSKKIEDFIFGIPLVISNKFINVEEFVVLINSLKDPFPLIPNIILWLFQGTLLKGLLLIVSTYFLMVLRSKVHLIRLTKMYNLFNLFIGLSHNKHKPFFELAHNYFIMYITPHRPACICQQTFLVRYPSALPPLHLPICQRRTFLHPVFIHLFVVKIEALTAVNK